MSYQGLRITDEGIFVRYRVKGETQEVGPFSTYAEALSKCRNTDIPPSDVQCRQTSLQY